MCSCARSACDPPLLAGVFGVGVYAWAWVSAAPRLSWLGCWGVCVFVCPLRLFPATPGWGVWWVCLCFGSGFGCTPPLLAGVLGCVCVRVPAPLVPRHSWLGCAAWVCVFGLGFRLRPTALGWGVGLCVHLCARSACTPPLLAGAGGVGVCAWSRVSAAPCHSWPGCWGVSLFVCALRLYPATPGWGVWCGCVCLGSGFGCAPPLLAGVLGCVCVCVRAPLVPLPLLAGVCDVGVWVACCLAPVPVPWFVACCAHCPGLRHRVAVVAWHLSVCRGFGQRRASLACLVAPRWCAAPRPVRLLSVLRLAFPTPWCLSPSRGLAPLDLLGGCAGHVEAGREPGSLCLLFAPAEAGALGSLRVVPVQGSAMGLSLAGPSGVGLGLRALRWLACVDPVTDASGFPYRPSFDGGLGRCTGAVSCGRRHLPLRVGGRHPWVPRVCACACFAWPGRAGRPPGCVLVRHFFLWPLCPCSLFSLLRAWVALFAVCFFFLPPFGCPRCLRRSVFSGPGCLGPWRLVRPPPFFFRPPPFFCSLVFCSLRFCLLFFSSALFVVLFCFFLGFFFSGCAVRCRFVCLWLWVVLVCGTVGAAVCGAFCVLCGMLVLGWDFVPCCPARCCAWSCLAVFVVFCCRVLLCSLLVFFLPCSVPFRGGPSCFGLCGARPWCVLLFGVALSRCVLVLASVPLCRLVLCRAMVRLLLPCCVVCFVAVLGSRLASSAAVACCCALSVLGRGAVSSCRDACGPCAVVPCAVFLGASLFAAPLVWCCVGVPVSLLSVRCSLAPLALAGVVCCCLLCSGVCCWAWLSSVVSWWLPVSRFGGAVPVWPSGSPPCGLVWCVSVLRSAVLCSVVLCCRVVVCCRALLSVCVVACACCLFPGAALFAVCVLVSFPVVGRLVVTPCSPVLCPVVLCCRVVLRCRVLVSFCGAVCACRRFWCRVSVVLSLSGRLARRPVVWCGVSGCSAPLCCVL